MDLKIKISVNYLYLIFYIIVIGKRQNSNTERTQENQQGKQGLSKVTKGTVINN